MLADIRELLGGFQASIWGAAEGAGKPTLIDFVSADSIAPEIDDRGAGLIAWAAHQNAGEICTDGERVGFVATPLPSSNGSRHVLVVVAAERGSLKLPREQLRTWLPRLARRLGTLQSLIDAQASAAKAERNADLLLLTATQLQDHRSIADLGASLCTAASHMLGTKRVALVRWNPTAASGEVAYSLRGHLVGAGSVVTPESHVGAACVGDFPVLIENATGRDRGFIVFGGDEPEHELGALAIVPLRGMDGVIGALVMESEHPIRISPTDAKNLRLLGVMAARALETVWEIEEINRRARTDALTGLANRQQFEERLSRIVMETNRFGGSCTLIVADIDRFKHVNDTYGHQVGDEVLRRVSVALQQEIRTVDLCARYGGEEMALLLPQTDLAGGCQLAERLRIAVGGRPFVIGGRDISVTLSLGVATYPEGARDRDELFSAADRALYGAKRGGRNMVVAGGL
ncbi:MAG: GGDEF domain-containing protein [Acidobacteriota bacterium]|nr:GGDEF domain-containing protein [Acidobacteriota bacterium]